MKKYIPIILSIICILSLAACGKSDSYEIEIVIPAGSKETVVYADEEISPTSDTIKISAGAGIVDTEVVLKPVQVKEENAYDEMLYLTQGMPIKVEVEKGAWFKIGVAMQNDSDVDIAVNVKVEGVEVRIANATEVNQEAEQWDLIPMVMVNGELYLDTGYESNAIERYDGFDGEITSEVDGSEKPIVNDQSNFGTGFGYQYGSTEGTIEIYMNEKWRIFATEEVRQELQFPEESNSDEIITYNGKKYKKSELSDQTLKWLELSYEERMLSCYYPGDLKTSGQPQWGITLTAENVTPTGLTIVCTQSDGEPTGELQTGSDYILEQLTEGAWKKVDYLSQEHEIAWTAEAYLIPTEDTVKWEVNWEWLYGELSAGQYRIGKGIMDFRESGDYDTAMHYAEFEITEQSYISESEHENTNE